MAKQAPPPKKETFLDRFKLGVIEKRKQQIDEASGWAEREPTPNARTRMIDKSDGMNDYINRRRQENLK